MLSVFHNFSTKLYLNKCIYCVFYVKINSTKTIISFKWPLEDIYRIQKHFYHYYTLLGYINLEKLLLTTHTHAKVCVSELLLGRRVGGCGVGGVNCLPILAVQLTLFQSGGGVDYVHTLTYSHPTPGF